MSISSYGGIIAAANEASAFPLHPVGDMTAVRRIVRNYQQAGIFPIVVMSGAQADAVRYELSSSGVVFLQAEQGWPELLESVKAGLAFLQDCCDRVVVTPVNTPLFSNQTLRSLMEAKGEIVSPSHNGRSGHPLVLSTSMIPRILGYRGDRGLRGAVDAMKEHRTWVDVEDDGILYTVHRRDASALLLSRRNAELLYLGVDLKLRKDGDIFDYRAKLLLFLIWKNHSVKMACAQMALSYSKAWGILNRLEKSLQLKLVQRSHGGTRGGHTTLTEQGIAFLQRYQELEEDIQRYSEKKMKALATALYP